MTPRSSRAPRKGPRAPHRADGHAGSRSRADTQVMDRAGDLADRIADAVRGCPEVAGLAGGTVATHLPGRAVRGVAVRDKGVRVAVVAEYGVSLAETASRVRAAVQPLVPGEPIDVHVEDVRLPDRPTTRR